MTNAAPEPAALVFTWRMGLAPEVATRIERMTWSVAAAMEIYRRRLREAPGVPLSQGTKKGPGRRPKSEETKRLDENLAKNAREALQILQGERKAQAWTLTGEELREKFFEALAEQFEKYGARRRRGKGTVEGAIRTVKERAYPTRK